MLFQPVADLAPDLGRAVVAETEDAIEAATKAGGQWGQGMGGNVQRTYNTRKRRFRRTPSCCTQMAVGVILSALRYLLGELSSTLVHSRSEVEVTKQSPDLEAIRLSAGSVFTPGSPVSERDLFSGRSQQLIEILNAASQRGYHAVLFGERGVGKTSIANILQAILPANDWRVFRVNCDASDTFDSLWRKLFSEVPMARSKDGIGFTAGTTTTVNSLAEQLPPLVTPDAVRKILHGITQSVAIVAVFDEFDRVDDITARTLMADTIKSLSDYSVNATVLIIGVADSVDHLLHGHQSIERALVQIPMPRMSRDETEEIFTNGLKRLAMSANREATASISSLSQGLPYITHLLGLHSVREALNHSRVQVRMEDVTAGIARALEQWQRSVVKDYYDATVSAQPGNIYKEVLLACALAETDELGFFTAAAVRQPLRQITGRTYDIPNFAQHLKNFSDLKRGAVLTRTGETRRIRYRFSGPLMRPYIVMVGFKDGLISREQMESVAAR
jgi:energy-coupling factor transporter ATP-binding protein EcfA2